LLFFLGGDGPEISSRGNVHVVLINSGSSRRLQIAEANGQRQMDDQRGEQKLEETGHGRRVVLRQSAPATCQPINLSAAMNQSSLR